MDICTNSVSATNSEEMVFRRGSSHIGARDSIGGTFCSQFSCNALLQYTVIYVTGIKSVLIMTMSLKKLMSLPTGIWY